MLKSLLLAATVLSISMQASATTHKSIKCTGATLTMNLQVESEDGGATTVAWDVSDSVSGFSSYYMGYLFSKKDLKEFTSTDLGSDVHIAGSVAFLTLDDSIKKEEVLLCK